MTLVSVASEHAMLSEDTCQAQRVLIVNENELIQAGLRAVLSDAPWVSGCAVAGNAGSALQIAPKLRPQLVLVSVSLGDRSGAQLCQWFRERMPYVKVVLTSGEGRVTAKLSMSLGAAGALSSHMPCDAILAVLKRVAEGGRVYPKASSEPETQLSKRERDVLQHVASGLSNAETAKALNLSPHTVKQHTSAVYRKLGVRNRAEASSRAQELGLMERGIAAGQQLRVG